jgi:hypothetical protein
MSTVDRLAFGVWRLAFGVWLLAFGVWRLAFRFWLFAFRFSLFAFRFSLFAFRFSLLAFRFSLFAFRFSLFAFRPIFASKFALESHEKYGPYRRDCKASQRLTVDREPRAESARRRRADLQSKSGVL